MRLQVTSEGVTHTIELDEEEEKGLVRVKIADREYLVDVSSPVSGLYSLLNDGRVFTAYVSQRRGRYEVQLGAWSTTVETALPERPGPVRKSTVAAAGRQEITAPMSGRVVQVLVQPGVSVQEGAAVLILEAMKMETEIRSPIPGQITEVRAEPGMAVETGQVLLVVEGN